MYHLLRYIVIILAINQSIYCSYRYAGCYTQVYHDTHYTSSFMEPTLCFRLCDTPIIYLQKTVCRCSGAGLMHNSELDPKLCNIKCAKPVHRSVKSPNTCGSGSAYSAYVLDKFYTLHGHLIDYKIQFSTCELWKKNYNAYETYEVQTNNNSIRSSLNKLERCAAACLDQNATTKSIAFNDDSDKCLCIMPLKSSQYYDRTHYVTILPNSSCDKYCSDTYEGATGKLKYQCGSSVNRQIWAIYDLNGTCPMNFVYAKELKKCVYTYRNFWNVCIPPSTIFTYDGTLKWNDFLKVIGRLQLNNSIVTVDVDENVVVDPSWKCSSIVSLTSSPSSSSTSWRSYYSQARSPFGGSRLTTRYILSDGCLQENSYTSYSSRYSYRLCVTNPVNRYSSTDDDDDDDGNATYIPAIFPQKQFCPTDWIDLNGRCYRMSDERKTIEQARNSCIIPSTSTVESVTLDKPRTWVFDRIGNLLDGDELNNSPQGKIVRYTSEWQARLGFFLLDTDPDTDNDNPYVTTTTMHDLYYDHALVLSDINETVNTNHGAINEFQAVNVIENETISMTNNTCVILTRSITEEEEKPILRDIRTENCSKPRHVLCETSTLIVQNFQSGCFRKPKSLDLPALISNQLTYELCLFVCQELQTKLAILHINKCYCLNGASPHLLNITTNFEEFNQDNCEDPCPGNPSEICGGKDSIVAFQILESRRTFTSSRTPAEPFPNYMYDNCVRLNIFNQSITYQFLITDKENMHPRYCLALCTKYNQKYALINHDECLCTNKPLRDEDDDIDVLTGQNCSQQCPGNYFYSCGNKDNVTIYSVYLLQPKCRHGFEVAENDEQCVYSHFSAKTNSLISAQNYCQALGSTLAKINQIEEIQDILPESILHTRLMQQLLVYYKFKYVNDTRYYWINRTIDLPDSNTKSDRLIKQCSQMPELIDRNCIAIQYVPNTDRTKASHERCITESNDCSKQTAMPVCVDQHLEPKPTLVPPITDDNPAQVSVDIIVDHSCDDTDEGNTYYFVDDYCYKIYPDEISWNDAKSKCQNDNAMVFVPEKSVSLQYIKSLYLRERPYSSSGFAHVGVYYENSNRTVIQYNTSNGGNQLTVPDSNAIYDLCEKTFQERYTVLMLSTSLTVTEKNRIKRQQLGCAYIDLTSTTVPTIRCDEIPCNRTATVICQKLPSTKSKTVQAKRQYLDVSKVDDVTNLPLTTTTVSSDSQSSTTPPLTTTVISSDDQSQADTPPEGKSIGRDFAPMFFILAIVFALILLGSISTLHNRRDSIFRRSQRRTTNSVYSQLTSANEFDLH